MNHKKATSREILGHIHECIYKARFKYDPCRSCDYSKPCENYTPSLQDKTADNNIPMIIRNNDIVIRKTSKILDWIRRYNDQGCV